MQPRIPRGPRYLPPHDKRVSYALSYLRGSAQRHFDTQLEDEEDADFMPPDWLHDWTRFAEELRDMFGDPNAEATAEADLDGLRMRTNQKFADFLVEFNTLSSQVNSAHAVAIFKKFTVIYPNKSLKTVR